MSILRSCIKNGMTCYDHVFVTKKFNFTCMMYVAIAYKAPQFVDEIFLV